MTIEVFKKVGKLYEWFINEEVHGSKTIFLGIKRHPSLVEEYW